MTDTSSSLAITHATTDPFAVRARAPLSFPSPGDASDLVTPDEEDYTIKCVCEYLDDDGSTVFCERCETWQHILCYYYTDDLVPEVHKCVECEPRDVDGRDATERQRAERKKTRAKAQKKKRDDNSLEPRHERTDSVAREHPPKKPKISHRVSTSISGPSGLPSLQPDGRKQRRSSTSVAPSPTKPSGPVIPLYSPEFLHLYDRDEEHENMDSNLFVNMNLVNDMANWVKNPEALAQVTGRSIAETFNWFYNVMDRSDWPSLATDTITDQTVEIGGRHPTWKIVKTQDAVRKDTIVGEMIGKVGLFDDYCRDPNNRWSELRHPEPMVFFSSHLPVYIDSRSEGSLLRYTRRSCRPNVTMKIFLTNEVEYHFCFVAKEDIPANTEITVMWYLDSKSSNGLVKLESGDSEAAAISISNTLATFGGCACEGPQNCLLASLDRRRPPKSLDFSMKQPTKKQKKVKTKPPTSPVIRAGSETNKNHDDDDAGDSMSASGSAPGQASPSYSSLSLSSRERRKLVEVEKQFSQLEDKRTTKRKKRASGSAAPPTLVTSSTQTGSVSRISGKKLRLDTSASQSRSPTACLSPRSLPGGRQASPRNVSGSGHRTKLSRPTFVDASTQVDMEELSQPRIGAQFIPTTIRLLGRFKVDRRRSMESARQQLSSAGSDSVVRSSSPLIQSPMVSSDMADAPENCSTHPIIDSVDSEMPNVENGLDPSRPIMPPPWPSTAAHNTRIPLSFVSGLSNMRMSMPPPTSTSALSPAVSPGSVSFASPPNADTSPRALVPPPISSAPTPTPTKKKLSLGDYLSRRADQTQAPKGPLTPGPGTTVNADIAQTHTPKPSPESKADILVGRDVLMEDAPESISSQFHSIPS
ncbi:hypothetical protein N7495_000318 [Penicillium taxi]|uniref:uncharacterized protein n=1 Tax=Penicillium taxi TaxID=168475 RepID=UPI0025451722|nr:uncharacterized protein N7495_000318 [Penicillium taxi]KAJ5907636.1 hypothetical protein N7495_000318 [Penicillium taxi]